jgi:uncharacterized low-complexity protein
MKLIEGKCGACSDKLIEGICGGKPTPAINNIAEGKCAGIGLMKVITEAKSKNINTIKPTV